MSDSSSNDQRRAPRINRRFVLRVAVFTQTPLAWSYVTIRNLSSTGIYFSFDRPVTVGQVLVFKIDFPHGLVECMGKVVRVEAGPANLYSDVAATFQGMDSETQQYIESFVRNWKPEK